VSQLERLAGRAREEGQLGIDTEFMPEGRYRPLLCLVQVAVGDEVVVLDPLGDELGDPAPLAAVLADPAVEVVVHAGRQDVAILRRFWGTEIRNVFDTQVAAGFLGLGSQEGYESLVRKVLNVRLGGSESFTRWDRRPLTAQQLEYAADDARCLLASGSRSGSSSEAGFAGRGRSAARSKAQATSVSPSSSTSGYRGSPG
jgi:ribonuclease D